MNKFTKILVSTGIAMAAFSAQAEDIHYPQSVISKATASQAAPVASQPTPYLFQGEFLVNNPAFKAAAGRSRDEVRQEARKARDAHASEFRA